jgi:hypothetical protein
MRYIIRLLVIGGLCGVVVGLCLVVTFVPIDSGRGKIPSIHGDFVVFVAWLFANEALGRFSVQCRG